MKIKKMNFIVCFAIFMLAKPTISAQTYVAEFLDNNNLWGYIDSDGKVIIPGKYVSSSPFCSEGYAMVKEPDSKVEKYIDLNDRVLGTQIEIKSCDPQDGCVAYLPIDSNNYVYWLAGERFIQYIQACKPFKDGMAPVKILFYAPDFSIRVWTRYERWGFINTSGELIIPSEYERVNYFCYGKAWVREDSTYKISLLDKQGKEIDISKHSISDYQNFSEGLAAVKIDKTWGFIDTSGSLVIENKYLKVGDFSDGLVWAKIDDKQMLYINKKGEEVIKGDFVSCDRLDPVSGMARVKSSSGWYYINKSGNKLEVNTKKYNDFQEGLCRADNNSKPLKIGFIKNDGTWAIEPQFDAASDFINGFATVRINDLWGLIDKNGKYIIEPIYKRLEDFYLVK